LCPILDIPDYLPFMSCMGIRVKICGIATEDALEAAASAGATYAGFVFYPRSPRNIAPLSNMVRGRVQTVALLADAADSEIAAVMSTVQPEFLQLHGPETPGRVAAVNAKAANLPGALPGGNGVAFEWTLLKEQGLWPNFMLSRGLSPDNVLDAVKVSGAPAADVSSGVEIAPGTKSPERIRSFMAKVKPFAQAV
jgi:phosphoribosylanthranilate isomerase